MAIRKRIERLEAKLGKSVCSGPSVIFLCDAETGEAQSALRIGGGSITKKPGESPEAFQARTENASRFLTA